MQNLLESIFAALWMCNRPMRTSRYVSFQAKIRVHWAQPLHQNRCRWTAHSAQTSLLGNLEQFDEKAGNVGNCLRSNQRSIRTWWQHAAKMWGSIRGSKHRVTNTIWLRIIVQHTDPRLSGRKEVFIFRRSSASGCSFEFMIYERMITLEPQCCTPLIRFVLAAYRLTCSNIAFLPATSPQNGPRDQS